MAKKVGTLIKEARTAAGMTQEQLAKKVKGASAADIGKAERGEKDLTQEQLKAIAKATGVTQKSLLDAAKGTAADVTIEAVAGKENTFYIKIGTQYLQHAVTGTNRRLVLTDTAAEWVASDHSAGGIQFVNNDAYMGTASATYNFIRSYKSASKSSVKYGLVFFKEN